MTFTAHKHVLCKHGIYFTICTNYQQLFSAVLVNNFLHPTLTRGYIPSKIKGVQVFLFVYLFVCLFVSLFVVCLLFVCLLFIRSLFLSLFLFSFFLLGGAQNLYVGWPSLKQGSDLISLIRL